MRILRFKEELIGLSVLLFLLAATPFTIYIVQKSQETRLRAEGIYANITVDTNKTIGILPRPWEALSQGGEEKGQMLAPVIDDVKMLSPRYIRIDHIFDQYNVVSRNENGSYIYDFSILDQTVNDILASGAIPFFSLSYMPPEFSERSIINTPRSWSDWQDLVKRTIEYYSGRKNRNLSNVFYEVWNEPDLFGGFDQYPNLYKYAVLGANNARDVLPFKIGGPGTSILERQNVWGKISYVEDFLKFVKGEGLRIDFISWHLYSADTSEFQLQAEKINIILSAFPEYLSLPKIISEWGSNSEMDIRHDTIFDAAHTISSLRLLLGRVDLAFNFEIKDGIKSDGTAYSGRWGILAHEKFGLTKKPRFYALLLATKLLPNRVEVSGEGTFVSAIASRNEDTVSLLLVNYDRNLIHSEMVPIIFRGLEKATYSLKKTILDESNPTGLTFLSENPALDGDLTYHILMSPNSVALLELKKLAPLYGFENGRFGYPEDFAILLTANSRQVSFPTLGNLSLPTGTIEMWIKPQWNGNDNKQYALFEIPLTDGNVFGAYKIMSGFGNVIAFGVWKEKDFPLNPIKTVSANIDFWPENVWQHVAFFYDKNRVSLAVNGTIGDGGKLSEPIDISAGQNLYLGSRQNASSPWNGLIDELRISKVVRVPQLPTKPYLIDNDTVSLRHFDGAITPSLL